MMAFFIIWNMIPVYSQYEAKNFIQYTITEGLSDNNISCIIQDNRGFMWIGTEFGLNRYDGNQFEKYYQGRPKGFLTSSAIHRFSAFKNNRLAVVTRNGLQVVNTEDFTISQFTISDSTPFQVQLNYFTSAMELEDGSIGATTATGFYVFDPEANLSFRHDAFDIRDIGNKRILYGKEIISLPNEKAFVYANEDQQAVYDIKQKTLKKVTSTEKEWRSVSQPPFYGWRAISQISDHEYIFLTRQDTLVYFDYSRGKKVVSRMPAYTQYNLTWESMVFMADDSTFFINGGYYGFYTFQLNRSTGKIRYHTDLFLPDLKIRCFYKDREDRLWIGTSEGLLKQKSLPAFSRVYHWPLNDFSRMGYTAGFRHGDHLYFSRFSQDTGLIIVNSSTMQIEKAFCFFGRNNSWNEVFGMQMYYPDTLWLGTNGGLLWFDIKSRRFGKVSELIPETNKSRWVYLNAAQPDHYAWMCDLLEGHVARLHIPTRQVDIFDSHTQPALPFSRVKHLCTDSHGDTWIGGHSLARWNSRTQTFDTLITSYGGPNPYEDDIKLLRADQEGSLWIHNMGNGLLQYKIQSKEWKHYGMNDGLPADVIQSMSIVKDHAMWMTSQNQLIHFDTQTGNIETYDKTDGIPDVKPVSGNMYFDSTTKDLYVFYKDHVVVLPFDYHQTSATENELFIQKVDVNNDHSFFFPKEELKLGPKENNLAIHFTLVDFHEGQPYRFAYRMDPKEDWTNLGYQRTLHLTNLAPGNYTMEIGATSKSGTKKTKTLSFTIAPPFWVTSWFILICIFVAVAIIYIIYRMRINQFQKKANLDKLLSQTEMKALHAQMNPHFIFNSLNSIREMILTNNIRDASRYLGNFAHLIRLTLNQSRQSFISLRQTMVYLELYIGMEKIRNSDFHFSMEAEPSLEPNETILPPMLIQPFIENAIWHGMNGENRKININVRFAKQNQQLVCTIEDDGAGIRNTQEKKMGTKGVHQSVSIENIRKRIELLNKRHHQRSSLDIEDKSMHNGKSETGTIVTIILPLEINRE